MFLRNDRHFLLRFYDACVEPVWSGYGTWTKLSKIFSWIAHNQMSEGSWICKAVEVEYLCHTSGTLACAVTQAAGFGRLGEMFDLIPKQYRTAARRSGSGGTLCGCALIAACGGQCHTPISGRFERTAKIDKMCDLYRTVLRN